jgi:hypothetical protein
MADNPAPTRPQDPHRVNLNDERELRYWTQKFDVSPEQLREAVQQVGPMAEDVADFLEAEARSR